MPGNIHSPTPKLKEGTFFLDPHFLESCHTPHPLEFHTITIRESVADQGKGPGGPPPLLLDQNEARRAGKNFLSSPPPAISGSGSPPLSPPPLSEGLDTPLGVSINTDGRRNTSATVLTEVD